MGFHRYGGGRALIVMKGHKAWIVYDGAERKIMHLRQIIVTVQKSSLGVENFSGAPILPFFGHQNFVNPPDFAKI